MSVKEMVINYKKSLPSIRFPSFKMSFLEGFFSAFDMSGWLTDKIKLDNDRNEDSKNAIIHDWKVLSQDMEVVFKKYSDYEQ